MFYTRNVSDKKRNVQGLETKRYDYNVTFPFPVYVSDLRL